MNARAPVEMFHGQHAEAARRREVERKQSEIIREQCCQVVQLCADAMRNPNFCRTDMERALAAMSKAYAAACVIDPEDE